MNPNTVQDEHITQGTMKSNLTHEKEQKIKLLSFHILKKDDRAASEETVQKPVGFHGEQ